MSTAPLEQAISTTRGLLASVTKDQLGADTPCASWKVSDLVNHIVGGQYFFVAMVEGVPPTDGGDYSAGDFVAAFDDGSAKCVAAFKGDGVMDKILTLPFGQMPGSAFVGIAATDTFTHGWDLAKATGQDTTIPEGLRSEALTVVEPVDAMWRMPGVLGPKVDAPDGASDTDKFAAFMGRQP